MGKIEALVDQLGEALPAEELDGCPELEDVKRLRPDEGSDTTKRPLGVEDQV